MRCGRRRVCWPQERYCLLKTLLRLQELDLRIEAFKAREIEIPKQKGKFEIYRRRLAAELEEREKSCRELVLEQRRCEGEIEQLQVQMEKYQKQLLAVKKNEEYQALCHEIDMLKKQVGLKEERIIAILVEIDEAQGRLGEDKKRINAELQGIEAQCAAIDKELEEAVAERKELQHQCKPLEKEVEPALLALYRRIRHSKKTGAVVVPLNDEVCSGCNMTLRPQIVNEVLAGDKAHTCSHCGRILYDRDSLEDTPDSN